MHASIYIPVSTWCVVLSFIFNYFLGLPGRCISTDVSGQAAMLMFLLDYLVAALALMLEVK